VPNIRSNRPAETRDFFVDLFGFEVAMDLDWVMTLASPDDPAVQITIISSDDMAAPGITVGVADVDAVHAKAVEQGLEIAYPLRDEAEGCGVSCSASPTGPSSTSCLTALIEGSRDKCRTESAHASVARGAAPRLKDAEILGKR
jgi:catechol 2,3-dioxygenase-like lactoylglutathione lyase family enzyme